MTGMCACTGACHYGGGCSARRWLGPPPPNPWSEVFPTHGRASCDHCFCIPAMVNGIAHKRCCNCGSQKVDVFAGIARGNTTVSYDTFSGDFIH